MQQQQGGRFATGRRHAPTGAGRGGDDRGAHRGLGGVSVRGRVPLHFAFPLDLPTPVLIAQSRWLVYLTRDSNDACYGRRVLRQLRYRARGSKGFSQLDLH